MSLTPKLLALPHEDFNVAHCEYDWASQTCMYPESEDPRAADSTWMGSDTGTRTHSGNEIFSDDSDTD